MDLNELLQRDGGVVDLDPESRQRMREAVMCAAHEDVARRARIVRLWRRRVLVLGAAAAAVVVVTAMPHSTGTPAVGGKRSTVPAVTGQFRTVAQVIDAAASATPEVNPTSGPYWKVTFRNCANRSACEWTVWNGINRNGVHLAGGPGNVTYVPECPATLTIGGKQMPWSAVNARTWSQSEINTLAQDISQLAVVRRSTANGEVTMSVETGKVTPSPALAFGNIVGILAQAPASATIKKQLWAALEAMPGIRLEGQHKDALGRTGWQITLATSGGGRESALVDTATGAVLEERYTWARGGGSVSTIVSAAVSQTAPKPSTPLAPSACSGGQDGSQ